MRLEQQIAFLREVDKLKTVIRQTYIVDESRQENTAEHSWHIAIAALTLAEHSDEPVDINRVIKMLLVHDIVEIDAGDTFAYDVAGHEDKDAREQRAADRLFGLLPDDQQREFRALWDEFEALQTPEARFARAVDMLMPMLHNYHSEGKGWRENGVVSQQVLNRQKQIGKASSALWEAGQKLVAEAVATGTLDE